MAKQINQTQIRVNKIVAAFLDMQDDLLIELHSLGLDTDTLQRPYVIRAVCEKFTDGKGWKEAESTGKVMLDTKHKRYEFLNTKVRDVMIALKGEKRERGNKSNGNTNPVDALLAQFEKLTAAQKRAFLKAVK
jgi:hypothetical protein